MIHSQKKKVLWGAIWTPKGAKIDLQGAWSSCGRQIGECVTKNPNLVLKGSKRVQLKKGALQHPLAKLIFLSNQCLQINPGQIDYRFDYLQDRLTIHNYIENDKMKYYRHPLIQHPQGFHMASWGSRSCRGRNICKTPI